jgi:hypothetical protein
MDFSAYQADFPGSHPTAPSPALVARAFHQDKQIHNINRGSARDHRWLRIKGANHRDCLGHCAMA